MTRSPDFPSSLDDTEQPLRVSRREMIGLITGAFTAGPSALAIAQGAPRRGGVLKVAAPANPSSLDPATGGAGTDHVFLFTMFDTLVEWEYATLQARPGLAESWSFTDPKTMVLNLRKGVVFHDGTAFDAAAVKFNLERAKTAPRSNIKADLATVDSVEATGSHQVTLKLNQPDAALPLILSDRAGMMASPKAIQALGNEHDRKPVGTGPWRLVNWSDGEKVSVTRNEKYWKAGMPYLDGIEMQIIIEVNTGLRSVVAGQNDYVYFLSPQQRAIIDRSKLGANSGPTLYCVQLYMNYGRPPLNDVRVRRAINHAIDRESFVKATMAGLAEAAWTQLPSAHWAFDKSLVNAWPHNIDTAKKLLAEAGHKDGLDLNLIGYTDQRAVQRQEVLMEQLRKAGFRVKFTNGSIADMSAKFFAQNGDGLLSAWTGRPDPSLTFSLMYMKSAYFNAGKAEPAPELTAAILASRASTDIEVRKRELSKVMKIISDQALVAPLFFQLELDAHGKKVQGYRTNLLGKPKFENVWLSE
ncbi:MAG TPA: ABC transporter substrate-binding protein [Burkholderiaceae bacterium]|nr:ABC transporter substrate-binding protein [Burkholderiaceae bacterium]